MKLILSTHNVKHTEAVEEHVRERISKLEHLDHKAIEARVTLEREETHGPNEREYKAGMRIAVSGPDYFAEDWETICLRRSISRQRKLSSRSASGTAKKKRSRIVKPPAKKRNGSKNRRVRRLA